MPTGLHGGAAREGPCVDSATWRLRAVSKGRDSLGGWTEDHGQTNPWQKPRPPAESVF